MPNVQNVSQSNASSMIPITDYGILQARYQALTITDRAKTVLSDAGPALKLADDTLRKLAGNASMKQVFAKIRKNALISGKMRPSEARDMMMDASSDFIEGTLHKLAAWRKTMERLGSGEGVSVEGGKEYISSKNPLALAIAGTAGISNYLSIIQLALMELSRSDKKSASEHKTTISEIRRCATILGDYENACGLATLVH